MTTPGPVRHPVYKALLRAPKFAQIDQRLLPPVIIVPLLVWFGGQFLVGPWAAPLAALLMAGLWIAARWASGRDPQIVQILWASRRLRARYDPAKHESFALTIR